MRLLEDEEWGKWSSYEIGRRCNVSHTFVDKLKLTCNVASEKSAERIFTTKHGTIATMQTANIGKAAVGG